MTDTIEKLYYKIGEVAEIVGEPAYNVRYWEKEFGLRVGKRTNGQREYTVKDVESIKMIHHLLKVRGFTTWGAKLEMKTKTTEI